MKKITTLFILVILLAQINFSQSLYSTKLDSLIMKDTGFVPDPALVEKLNPQKPLWVPIVESVGLNLALGAFNYLMGSEFAKIGFSTIKHNHEIGWTTDAGAFLTNMFAHPFHGSIYYNLARSSGYNYWTSLGVGAIGSWQWEFFMENEPPAFNDWIMTSYGGSMLGEMFYRFSNLIIDESATGSERFWRELGAGIFNTGRLFNRLIDGRTSRVTNEKLYEKQLFLGELALGGNNVADGTNFENGQKNMMFSIDLAYGKLFDRRSTFKPFDYFRFNFALNFGGVQPLIGEFRINNTFYGKATGQHDGGRFIWGIFGHYDFVSNNVYEVGGVSTSLGIGYRTPPRKSVQFIGLLHAGIILMGGANSDYSEEYKVSFLDSARTYNMGPGAMTKLEAFLRFPFGALSVAYSFWWIHTWDGAPGDEYIGMLAPKLRIHIYKRWFVGLEYLLYHRVGAYDDFPDRDLRNNEQRVFIGYSF